MAQISAQATHTSSSGLSVIIWLDKATKSVLFVYDLDQRIQLTYSYCWSERSRKCRSHLKTQPARFTCRPITRTQRARTYMFSPYRNWKARISNSLFSSENGTFVDVIREEQHHSETMRWPKYSSGDWRRPQATLKLNMKGRDKPLGEKHRTTNNYSPTSAPRVWIRNSLQGPERKNCARFPRKAKRCTCTPAGSTSCMDVENPISLNIDAFPELL
jgi:hypothetical protein